MLDTNIFNMLMSGSLQVTDLPSDGCFYATYVQREEINRTSNADIRRRLVDTFNAVTHEVAPVETALFGVTPFNEGKYGGGSETYQTLLRLLDMRNASRQNNFCDVLIAETAIANNMTLITSDGDLAEIMKEFGASVEFYPYFRSVS